MGNDNSITNSNRSGFWQGHAPKITLPEHDPILVSLIVRQSDDIGRYLSGPGEISVRPLSSAECLKIVGGQTENLYLLNQPIQLAMLRQNDQMILTAEIEKSQNVIYALGQYYPQLCENYPNNTSLVLPSIVDFASGLQHQSQLINTFKLGLPYEFQQKLDKILEEQHKEISLTPAF